MATPIQRLIGTQQNLKSTLSLTNFRANITRHGIGPALLSAQEGGVSLKDLAIGFEATHPWADDPKEQKMIRALFEAQLVKLEELNLLLNTAPDLPERSNSLFSIGLRVFPIAEQEWDQVDWSLTSDVSKFFTSVQSIIHLMSDKESADLTRQTAAFVLPQGEFYLPAHVRIGVDKRHVKCIEENHDLFAKLGVELFLPTVPYDRARHASHSGYAQFYISQSGSHGIFTKPAYEAVIRSPALWGGLKASWINCLGIELHECFTASDPAAKAKETLQKISDVVRELTSGEVQSVREFIRDVRITNKVEQFVELRRALFKALDVL